MLSPDENWGSIKIGAGTPPVRVTLGGTTAWLALFTASTAIEARGQRPSLQYCAGIVIHDLERPDRILYRSPAPVLTPESSEERKGVVDNVVFPTGLDPRPDLGDHVLRRLLRHGRLLPIGAARLYCRDRRPTPRDKISAVSAVIVLGIGDRRSGVGASRPDSDQDRLSLRARSAEAGRVERRAQSGAVAPLSGDAPWALVGAARVFDANLESSRLPRATWPRICRKTRSGSYACRRTYRLGIARSRSIAVKRSFGEATIAFEFLPAYSFTARAREIVMMREASGSVELRVYEPVRSHDGRTPRFSTRYASGAPLRSSRTPTPARPR